MGSMIPMRQVQGVRNIKEPGEYALHQEALGHQDVIKGALLWLGLPAENKPCAVARVPLTFGDRPCARMRWNGSVDAPLLEWPVRGYWVSHGHLIQS